MRVSVLEPGRRDCPKGFTSTGEIQWLIEDSRLSRGTFETTWAMDGRARERN
jgi:hypothetical protein